jgi:hypothetical protein
VDIRCCKYAQGPIRAAHDAKNRTEPTVQLEPPRDQSVSDDFDNAHQQESTIHFLGIDGRNSIAS